MRAGHVARNPKTGPTRSNRPFSNMGGQMTQEGFCMLTSRSREQGLWAGGAGGRAACSLRLRIWAGVAQLCGATAAGQHRHAVLEANMHAQLHHTCSWSASAARLSGRPLQPSNRPSQRYCIAAMEDGQATDIHGTCHSCVAFSMHAAVTTWATWSGSKAGMAA